MPGWFLTCSEFGDVLLTTLVIQCVALGMVLAAYHWTEHPRERGLYRALAVAVLISAGITLYCVTAYK